MKRTLWETAAAIVVGLLIAAVLVGCASQKEMRDAFRDGDRLLFDSQGTAYRASHAIGDLYYISKYTSLK
jgi:hypothetical protein